MADDVELIVQLPRDSPVDLHFRENLPPSIASGQVILDHLPADSRGRIIAPPAGEVIVSVLSPEALAREAEQISRQIREAPAGGEPLVIQVQAAEELREEELAAVLDAAASTGRVVLLRILSSG